MGFNTFYEFLFVYPFDFETIGVNRFFCSPPLLPDAYLRRVLTLFEYEKKNLMLKLFDSSVCDKDTHIFRLLELLQSGVVVTTWRSFHIRNQKLGISQGIIGESEFALRRLCSHKT